MVSSRTDHSIWCKNRFFVCCILQTHISCSPPKSSALPSQLKVALTCLPISSSPLWSQTSSLSDLLQWPSTWVSAHIVNLSKLDVIQWFSNPIKMQIWASFILLQVLHGSEDKGKTNLIRTMRPHMLCFLLTLLLYLITDFTPVFHQLLRFVCWSSDIFVCLLQPGSLYLHFFLSDYKESSSFPFSYYLSFRYKRKHFWDSVFWVRCFCYLFSFN